MKYWLRQLFIIGGTAAGLSGLAAIAWQASSFPAVWLPIDIEQRVATGPPTAATAAPIAPIGPREGIPADAPTAYGFWSLAMPAAGIFSRSGQPLLAEFIWLKDQGWQSVINLRVDGERNETGDDSRLPGFNELDFNYLHLPITDGHPPTDQQAREFLGFITKKENQPVHIHCRGGIGRTGAMTALYRYAVDSWPMDKAIDESRAFQGGVSSLQTKWLEEWASTHVPGEWQTD